MNQDNSIVLEPFMLPWLQIGFRVSGGDLTGLFWTKRCERIGLAKELSDAEEAV